MKSIKAFTLQFPLLFAILVLALTMVITEIPLNNLFQKFCDLQTAYYLSGTLEQALCAAAVAFYISHAGILYHAGMVKPRQAKTLWLIWPILVLTIINGLDLFDGTIAIDTSRPIVLFFFVLIVLSTGFFEEVLCRGLVLSACMKKWGKTKKGIYLSVIVSSVIFGLFHLINLVMGRGSFLQVMTQIIYAFFFGVFFSACFLRFDSIWPAIITHTLFDIMGTIDEVAVGNNFSSHTLNMNTSLGNALSTILVTLPLFLYGLYIMRKVRPKAQAEVIGNASQPVLQK